jgi:hypothetical protein
VEGINNCKQLDHEWRMQGETEEDRASVRFGASAGFEPIGKIRTIRGASDPSDVSQTVATRHAADIAFALRESAGVARVSDIRGSRLLTRASTQRKNDVLHVS